MLNNNLTKKRERLQQELREVSLEEQDKRLSGFRTDKSEVEKRMTELDQQTLGKADSVWLHMILVQMGIGNIQNVKLAANVETNRIFAE